MNSENAPGEKHGASCLHLWFVFGDWLMDLPVVVVFCEGGIHWFKMRTRQHLPIQ